ncbi:hypothetical protein FHS29_007100 [Saccharothrix tamanrassetensis]|uniref:Uncharacterized protein n=1 Tax=Saccharothrix tamanrassetensis TaxID=1051531 RepID=A0A841CYT0_9PSEU|nr:hypothetical protein [Saccharothrix tamanrassetensis]MBB5960476.1 hypothetical protein [Saccharothrix tamanrassetensis]
MAGRARAAPCLPLAVLAAELRDAAIRLDVLDSDDPAASLPAVLSWSQQLLTSEQQEVFGCSASRPVPTSASLPPQISPDCPPARTKRVLDALDEASLLDHDGHGRWRMHDLIGAYATTAAHELDEPARESALRRVVDFYAHTAYAAFNLIWPNRPRLELDAPSPSAHPQTLPDVADRVGPSTGRRHVRRRSGKAGFSSRPCRMSRDRGFTSILQSDRRDRGSARCGTGQNTAMVERSNRFTGRSLCRAFVARYMPNRTLSAES